MVRLVVLQLAFRTCRRGRLHSAVRGRATIHLVTAIALGAGLLLGKLGVRHWRTGECQGDNETNCFVFHCLCGLITFACFATDLALPYAFPAGLAPRNAARVVRCSRAGALFSIPRESHAVLSTCNFYVI